jgi:hypothetical protein
VDGADCDHKRANNPGTALLGRPVRGIKLPRGYPGHSREAHYEHNYGSAVVRLNAVTDPSAVRQRNWPSGLPRRTISWQ